MLSRTFFRTTRSLYRPSTFIPSRALSQTTRVAARKDAMGKDDLKPEPNEYSKSASDDEAARIDGTAFNPNQTRPEEQLESGEQEKGTVSAPSKGEVRQSPYTSTLLYCHSWGDGETAVSFQSPFSFCLFTFYHLPRPASPLREFFLYRTQILT